MIIGVIFIVNLIWMGEGKCFVTSDLAEKSGDVDDYYCLNKGWELNSNADDNGSFIEHGPINIPNSARAYFLWKARDEGRWDILQCYFWGDFEVHRPEETGSANNGVDFDKLNGLTEENYNIYKQMAYNEFNGIVKEFEMDVLILEEEYLNEEIEVILRSTVELEEINVIYGSVVLNDRGEYNCEFKDNLYHYTIMANAEHISEGEVKITATYKYYEYDAKYVWYRSEFYGKNHTISTGDVLGPIQDLAKLTTNREEKTMSKSIEIPKASFEPEVKIKKYIYSIDEEKVEYVKKDSKDVWKYKNDNSQKGDRKNWSETEKKKQPAVLENGSKIVYKVEVKNEEKKKVYVKLKDTLPEICEDIKITKGNEEVTGLSNKIEAEDWPGVEDRENTKDRKTQGYLEVPKEDSIVFTISARVNAPDTNGKYYKPGSPLGAKAEIVGIKRKASSDKVLEAKDGKSSDYFTLKKYNVSVDSYISGVNRANGEGVQNGEYLVENEDYRLGKRNGRENEEKKGNAVFIENGDIVTYTIKVSNNANEEGPYYKPKEVSVNVTNLLPTDKCEIKQTSVKCTQEGSKVIFDTFKIGNKKTKEITLKVQINTDMKKIYENEIIRENVTKITNISNIHGKQGKETEIKNEGKPKTASDYFQIKDYHVGIDQYIQRVEHQQDRGGSLTSYDAEARRFKADENKGNNAVSVEYGDIVTYKIRIYNTTSTGEYNIGKNRNEAPYREPQYIYVDIKDTLPKKYSVLTASSNYTVEGQTIKFNNVKVEKNGVGEITVRLIVEEDRKGIEEINRAEISGDVRNLNGYAVKNHGNRTTAIDKYKVNDYNVSLEGYITAYHAEMAKYNNANGFTRGEREGLDNSRMNYPNNNPLEVEKYETLTITTKVTNDAKVGINGNTETEDNNEGNGKYTTRVRPSTIETAIGTGLNKTGFRAEWYHADGTLKKDITGSISISGNSHSIIDDNIILSPGEYILYVTDIKVVESNLCLNNIEVSSRITKLTNINKNSSNDREVTSQNVASKKEGKNYVRLKDVVIAGTVWEDTNRDGMNNERGKRGVVVRLYRIGQVDPVKITVTNENGFYTFERVQKADKDENKNYRGSHYEYYVEFEYDGVTYKATEVYGGDKDGDADGMHNLGGRQGSSTWRQGYSDLPDAKSGNENYKIDSNAYEFDNIRSAFNNDYQTIGFNQSYKEASPNKKLAYSKEDHKSTLIEDAGRIMKARSFIKQNYNETVNEDLNNTNNLFLEKHSAHGGNPETEYLKFINLGLVKREQVDISIESDVHSVKTTINGEEMTYNYNKNNADSTAADYNSQTNAYKLNQAYNLNLYEADYNYRKDSYYTGDGNYDANAIKDYKTEQSELAAEVTYRIRIHNNGITEDDVNTTKVKDIPVETAINEMAIYYNKNFVQDWNDSKIVKVKNVETGLFKDRTVKAIRVNYGTESELDGLINNTENTKTNIIISANSNYGNTKPNDQNMSDYNVLYLNIPENYIKEGETKYIQITFTIDKDTERKLKLTQQDMGFEMVSEVSAYTTKYSDTYAHKGLAGKYAGLVDRDSNPGNLHLNGIENYNNYEDDKYKVGITMDRFKNPPDNPPDNPDETPGKRSVTGMVFEDARSEEVRKDGENVVQYMGNGEYKTSDKNHDKANINPYNELTEDRPVAGVKVSLIEVVQKGNGIYYEYPARDSRGELIEVVTGTDGKYVLTDFIPGYYKVRFDYGYNSEDRNSILYNGQDYKSTKYYDEGLYYENNEGYQTDNIGSQKNFGYFDKVKTALGKVNRSDAQDDEIRRLNVNSYSETMTATEAKLFFDVESIAKDLTNKETDAEKLTKNTHMYAESAIFYVKPEAVKSSDKEIDASGPNFDETRLWKIQNLDFGLEYRPEASVILDKNISTVELVTSDNKTLIKLYFKKDASGKVTLDKEKSKGYENVQFLQNNEKVTQGFAYINMDTKILEGCTIKVEYQMDASNESEVDRINQNLHEIRYEMRAANQKYKGVFYSNNYNANGTAAEALSQQYYEKKNGKDYYSPEEGKEVYSYLKKIKKPYKATNKTIINGTQGEEYYGMYLGQTYYTGKVRDRDIVAQLKVDHILDYIDNDFTFNLLENNTKNKLWQTTTSKELKDRKMLDFSKVYVDDSELNLVDKNGIRYDTENRSNLALSVDDNKNGKFSTGNIDGEERNGNVSLSRFLQTKKASQKAEEYTGFIRAVASKVLSAEDITKGTGLSYENMAEVVQYRSITGRRTKLPEGEGEGGGVIGNANVNDIFEGEDPEDDTDATEVISITPPTGLLK